MTQVLQAELSLRKATRQGGDLAASTAGRPVTRNGQFDRQNGSTSSPCTTSTPTHSPSPRTLPPPPAPHQPRLPPRLLHQPRHQRAPAGLRVCAQWQPRQLAALPCQRCAAGLAAQDARAAGSGARVSGLQLAGGGKGMSWGNGRSVWCGEIVADGSPGREIDVGFSKQCFVRDLPTAVRSGWDDARCTYAGTRNITHSPPPCQRHPPRSPSRMICTSLPPCPPGCLPTCPPTCLPTRPPACLPTRPPACPPARLPACQPAHSPARSIQYLHEGADIRVVHGQRAAGRAGEPAEAQAGERGVGSKRASCWVVG